MSDFPEHSLFVDKSIRNNFNNCLPQFHIFHHFLSKISNGHRAIKVCVNRAQFCRACHILLKVFDLYFPFSRNCRKLTSSQLVNS